MNLSIQFSEPLSPIAFFKINFTFSGFRSGGERFVKDKDKRGVGFGSFIITKIMLI